MYTFKELVAQCRNQNFLIDGVNQPLHSKRGEELISDLFLKEIVNEAINDVNIGLRVQAEVKVDNCINDSDEKLMPTDVLSVKKLEIFTEESPSVPQGNPIEQVFSQDQLYYLGLNPDNGQPDRFMVWENQEAKYFKFNRKCGAAYQLIIYYWPLQQKLSVDGDATKIARPYDSLIRYKANQKIAYTLNANWDAFDAAYKRELKDKQSSLNAGRPAVRTIIREMPGL